jgi:hypothetical protein
MYIVYGKVHNHPLRILWGEAVNRVYTDEDINAKITSTVLLMSYSFIRVCVCVCTVLNILRTAGNNYILYWRSNDE